MQNSYLHHLQVACTSVVSRLTSQNVNVGYRTRTYIISKWLNVNVEYRTQLVPTPPTSHLRACVPTRQPNTMSSHSTFIGLEVHTALKWRSQARSVRYIHCGNCSSSITPTQNSKHEFGSCV